MDTSLEQVSRTSLGFNVSDEEMREARDKINFAADEIERRMRGHPVTPEAEA
ncbi:MAG: hypothetical protein V2I33_25620 [Kangiellaceae bacterium]|jgi:hypothetical protein|nr:hypothetical protein [Kangiellaceae bacterium]